MEDMARLALIEQSVRDIDKYSKLMHELLRHFTNILENPQDNHLRTIKSNILKDYLKLDAFSEYLKYVGFELIEDNFVYPNKQPFINLRTAQIAIERKISICCGPIDKNQTIVEPTPSQSVVKILIEPANVLNTSNPFLLKIQQLFNNMLKYEDPELLAYAREQIPIASLQVLALERVRKQQKKVKTGVYKGPDLAFEIALLMELMVWFKFKFFTWVDTPTCKCGGAATPAGGATLKSRGEICKVELYKCLLCRSLVRFPRYNNPRTLLEWRRGRCGEWANCFTLLCRALHYDVRYVYDVTDHVWCEVFDNDSNTWLHCDPCEARLDAPLMYSHGWGKKLSYVIAVSRDDLQDVTWRYVMNHKEVLKNRKECSEQSLIDCIVKLRYHRQKQGSEARRIYLAKRTALELVHLMKERKPELSESIGRITGSAAWRLMRGECGSGREPHTFTLTDRGQYKIGYNCARDRYTVSRDSVELETLVMWAAGAHVLKGVFRKVEHDWKHAYLARNEGVSTGEISWQFSASSGLACKQLSLKITSALYEDAKICWSLVFDAEEPVLVDLGETPVDFKRTFRSVTVRAVLSGGSGAVAWQHAQLFRQPLNADTPAFLVIVHVE